MKNSLYLRLALNACAILFLELLLIRWVSTEINIFAYLQNSILVVCFLGLGMGLLYPSSERKWSRATACSLLVLSVMLSFQSFRTQANTVISWALATCHDFVIWNEVVFAGGLSSKVFLFVAAFGLIFIFAGLIWGIMVPLGRSLGGYFEQAGSPIKAYSYDIGGSLLGIWLYSLLGYFSLPPAVWLIFAAILLFPLIEWKFWILLVLCPAVALLGYSSDQGLTYWTPYQKIEIKEIADEDQEYFVSTNNSGFQQIQNNSKERYKARFDELALSQYDIAARFHPNPKAVFIAGVGTGNDLAGVLRQQPHAEILGVEIDPAIPRLGKMFHPERPYQSPQVTLQVEDARASFHNAPRGKFDLVITGLLDSHTTPNLSNARLDNFVYTQEAIEALSGLLSPSGVLVLSFDPQRPYIVERLRRTLDSVFSTPTLAFRIQGNEFGWGGVLFVNGSQSTIQQVLQDNQDISNFIRQRKEAQNPELSIQPTTDNWPYLYIQSPTIPALFFFLAIVILLLWAFTSRLFKRRRFVAPKLSQREPLHFFALGIGFIVIQVYIITKASLLFGSTWIVNAVVISGMLITILIANSLVATKLFSQLKAIALLLIGVCIALGICSFTATLSYPLSIRILIGILISGLPTLLSGVLFGYAFVAAENQSKALGANLFGALVGSIIQFIVFLLGIDSLAYIGAIAYVVALLSLSPRVQKLR